jgi:hypothetical protein
MKTINIIVRQLRQRRQRLLQRNRAPERGMTMC